MITVAIVEDNEREVAALTGYFSRLGEELGLEFRLTQYYDALSFFDSAKRIFDIVMMDIDLPHLDGMSAACRLRETDGQTVLIFVTNMAQFAVKGYEVDALDFIVKPLSYHQFSLKLKRAVEVVVQRSEGSVLNIPQAGGVRRISTAQLYYLEVKGHTLYYHTAEGVFSGWSPLGEMEQQLRPHHFFRCHNSLLVNPRHIRAVDGHTILMSNGAKLTISRPRKKQFMMDLAGYFGKGTV